MRRELEAAIRELEQAARELRAGELEGEGAAELVDRCAQLAADIGTELDLAAREADRDVPATDQERLL